MAGQARATRSSRTCCALASVCLLLVAAPRGLAAEATHRHLGAASCASSNCHGKVAPQPGQNVALNEYRVWSQDDRHSLAYRTLETAESKLIAQKLGLPSATTAKICLDCHADNVPQARRGPKFQLSDGVGCEACHGGAEKWIESHAERKATHRDNVAKGMTALEAPRRRAELCVNCHVGAADRFATHAIMGAGHPRLSFELESFTANQPAHYVVDEDYVRRKGRPGGVNLWLAGQAAAASRQLALLQSNRFLPGGLFAELAFYDCHSCHHRMNERRWTAARAGAGVKPGSLRLQQQHFLMLEAAAQALGAGPAARQLADGRAALIRAGQSDAAAVRASAARLAGLIRAQESWTTRAHGREQASALRRTLLQYAAADRTSDFSSAEQVVLGVESLSYTMGDRERRRAALDALFNAVKDASTYNPRQFADVAQRVQSQF